MKRCSIGMLLLLVLGCAIAGCGSDGSKAAYGKEDVKRLVDDAYDYVKVHGKKKALEEFMNAKGSFVKGELYIYAYDFDGKVISHGGDPTLVGKNLIGYEDPNGVKAVEKAATLAKTEGEGWLECMFPNPLTKKQQKKLIFVKKVDDGWFLGSGLYR